MDYFRLNEAEPLRQRRLNDLARMAANANIYNVTPRTSTYTETAISGEHIIAASGTFTINLPTAVGNTAKLQIKLVGAGTVTIDPSGAETIDGAATFAISTVWESVTLISDGANWLVI